MKIELSLQSRSIVWMQAQSYVITASKYLAIALDLPLSYWIYQKLMIKACIFFLVFRHEIQLNIEK